MFFEFANTPIRNKPTRICKTQTIAAKKITAVMISSTLVMERAPRAMVTIRESRATGPTAGCHDVPIKT